MAQQPSQSSLSSISFLSISSFSFTSSLNCTSFTCSRGDNTETLAVTGYTAIFCIAGGCLIPAAPHVRMFLNCASSSLSASASFLCYSSSSCSLPTICWCRSLCCCSASAIPLACAWFSSAIASSIAISNCSSSCFNAAAYVLMSPPTASLCTPRAAVAFSARRNSSKCSIGVEYSNWRSSGGPAGLQAIRALHCTMDTGAAAPPQSICHPVRRCEGSVLHRAKNSTQLQDAIEREQYDWAEEKSEAQRYFRTAPRSRSRDEGGDKIYIFNAAEQTHHKLCSAFGKSNVKLLPSSEIIYAKARNNFSIDKLKYFIKMNQMLKEVQIVVECSPLEASDSERVLCYSNLII